MQNPNDPFRDAREESGVLKAEFQGRPIPMILRHDEVRKAAKDWNTFSSDAPFRVPIPSEEDVRSMRQLPVETDPPDHTEYRDLVEPVFRRAKDPAMVARVEGIIGGRVRDAVAGGPVEVVRQFALPIQSEALAVLLNVPQSEAAIWIGWGTHVFRDGGNGARKGAALEEYLHSRFDRAEADPGDDFFSLLSTVEFRGRRLTREEKMGFANLAFAGGRDTVIHSISSTLAYLGRNPAALGFLREDPRRIVNACEEIFRHVSPLTHIGRVCPVDTDVHGVPVKAGGGVSLCWASANHDASVFERPEEVRLDRKPNPHMAFGAGAHLCLGAAHARLLLRTLLQACVDHVGRVEVLAAVERVEDEASYRRVMGYESLTVRLHPREASTP